MLPYPIEEIKTRVIDAVGSYNESAANDNRILRVSLFGSYAEGRATPSSDVDLLVSFATPAVSLLTLARVLTVMEEHLGVSVDIVQEPVPQESYLEIRKVIPLYEGLEAEL